MKQFQSSNSELIELLVDNGIELICDDNQNIVVSNEDAEKIEEIVNRFAPAAIYDYTIE